MHDLFKWQINKHMAHQQHPKPTNMLCLLALLIASKKSHGANSNMSLDHCPLKPSSLWKKIERKVEEIAAGDFIASPATMNVTEIFAVYDLHPNKLRWRRRALLDTLDTLTEASSEAATLRTHRNHQLELLKAHQKTLNKSEFKFMDVCMNLSPLGNCS